MAYLRKQGGTAKNISPLRPVVSGAGAFYTKKGVHTLEQVKILDTTLRDGEQTPGVSFQLKEKVEVARALEDLGVDVIEAGFAPPHPRETSRPFPPSPIRCAAA